MRCTNCDKDALMIDNKGFIYCIQHGENRKLSTPCRKMSIKEINLINEGKPISYGKAVIKKQTVLMDCGHAVDDDCLC
jgi:hypothetical protein